MVQFDVLNTKPTGRKGRPTALKNVSQVKLYPRTRPVGALKKQDMLDLLPFIPPVHHHFFRSLKTESKDEEDNIGPLPVYENDADDRNDELENN